MKSIQVFDIKGKVVGKFPLDQTYFNSSLKKPLLHQAVLMYLSNKRHGCASTKTRKQVRGGGRKPWRQKGTGRARCGSIRSPLWRGGGVVFGPHPRQYRYTLPENIRNLALQHSLNSKVEENNLLVIDNISLNKPKTREFAKFLTALKAEDKPLIVIESHNQDILKAARNIPGVTVEAFNNINAYEVLRHKKIIFSKQALENLIKLKKR